MPTLTETRIEIADRHTSLCFLREPPENGALQQLGFDKLYEHVCLAQDVDFGALSQNSNSALGRLRPVCNKHNQRFWREYLSADFDSSLACDDALPILAAVNEFISLAPIGAKVAPMLTVALYPFGWSTWLSLRVTGEHSLAAIEQMLVQLFASQSILLSDKTAVTVQELFDRVAGSMRVQVFAGKATHDGISRDMLVTTTVISKFGGSPSVSAMTEDGENQMKRIVVPRGRISQKPFKEHIYNLDAERPEVNFLVHDNLGRFTWFERLLEPNGYNRQNLICHHSNDFSLLLQAWHWEGFLAAAADLNPKSEEIKSLIETGVGRLKWPKRKSASLLLFLQSAAVTEAVSA